MSGRPRSLLAVLFLAAVLAQACGLSNLREAREEAGVLPQTTFLFAADGTLITELHAGENRIIVPLTKIPAVVRDAVVAIEDQRFYDHHGIDLRALLRAAYIDATTGEVVEGGSTITQQLVKNIYLGAEQTLGRKIREAALAWQLEQRFSKDQILTKYLNTVYFGNGAYGIQAAAQTYFSESAPAVTLPQAALLAGLIAAPVNYDPAVHPDRARARRNHVLERMLELGMITSADYAQAAQAPVELNMTAPAAERRYIAPYFVDYFKEWFLSNPRFGETPQERYDLLFKGGLRITTTLVPRLQEEAERAIESILIYKTDPWAAMSVVDPRTGYVKAMVGGRNYWDEADTFARINLATGGSTGRQTGSAFKPFALVAALENGFTPRSYLNGSYAKIPLQDGTYWTPGNAEGGGYGTISLETATVHSVNIAYANLELQLGGGDAYLGAQKIVEAAERMGIRCCPRTSEPNTPLQPVPAAVLGSNEVSPLEMASGYGTLAFGGRHVQPTPVIRITNTEGEVVYDHEPKPDQVVNPAVAAVAVDIMKKVVQSGTGTAANIDRPQIGKTGTEDLYRDAWFVGAIPQLVAAVWVGFPQGQVSMEPPTTRIKVFGGTWPAQIWHAFMFNAVKHIPIREFPAPPSGVEYVTLRVDITQGCLANPFTPPRSIRTYQFIAGTEPELKVCKEPTEYQDLTVPSVVGLEKQKATDLLHASGFAVEVTYTVSDQPEGTVIAQDPGAGELLMQTGTVTITVVKGQVSPTPTLVVVPNVVGMTEGAATAALRNAGFEVAVVYEAQCDPADPTCDAQPGIVWAQTPAGDKTAEPGSTVTIVVNP